MKERLSTIGLYALAAAVLLGVGWTAVSAFHAFTVGNYVEAVVGLAFVAAWFLAPSKKDDEED